MANKSNKIGATFEEKFIAKCERLEKDGQILMTKIPTEFKIIRGSGGKIINVISNKQNKWVDFVGVLPNGRSISIETKTTANKTSFPLSNIEETQFEFFKKYLKMNGLGYYVIEFRELREVYFVKAIDIEIFKDTNNRKSIPIKWFREKAMLLDKDLNFIKYIYN